MSFPRYPKYKESGEEWLGQVPEQWNVWKLAHAFPVIGSGTTPKTDEREYYDDGDVPWVNTGDLGDAELDACQRHVTNKALAAHSSLRLYEPGSLVIAMYGATIGKLAVLRFASTVNQACCVLGGRSPIRAKFQFYWFIGMRQKLLSLATGGGQPNISQEILRSLRVACPPAAEQDAIVAFLDRETSKIDALVAEQERLIELLNEKRQAVISLAVTKGLNPSAPMRDSGIEWLGHVPKHWEVKKLRFVCDIQTGGRDTEHAVDDGPFPFFVRSQNVERIDSWSADCEAVLTAGDGAGVGKVFHHFAGKFDFHQRVYMLNNFRGVTGRFLFHYLRENFYKVALEGGAKSTVDSLRRPMFLNFWVCLPPSNEQEDVIRHVDREARRMDSLISESERAAQVLLERRSALISAAVTGQIDVRPESMRSAA